MTTIRRASLIRSLKVGREANGELRKTLQWGQRQVDRLLRELEAGASLADITERVDLGDVRERISAALDQFERTRHEVKVASFALAREESLSIGDLSRKWRISRQRGQQYAHESKDRSGT